MPDVATKCPYLLYSESAQLVEISSISVLAAIGARPIAVPLVEENDSRD